MWTQVARGGGVDCVDAHIAPDVLVSDSGGDPAAEVPACKRIVEDCRYLYGDLPLRQQVNCASCQRLGAARSRAATHQQVPNGGLSGGPLPRVQRQAMCLTG